MSNGKYPITGSVWFRESTQEWVLELEGSINGTYFINRHTEPSTTLPEDVPGLPSLYGKLAQAEKGLTCIRDGSYGKYASPAAIARATLAEIKPHSGEFATQKEGNQNGK